MTSRSLIVAAAVLLAGLANIGCGQKTESNGPPPPSPEQQVQQIQNNPNLPPQAKERAIAAIQAARASTPKPTQTQAPKH